MFKKYYMSINIGELTVSWKKTDSYEEDGFEVELAYKGNVFVKQEILNKNKSMLPFSLLRSGGVNIKGSLGWQEENNIPFIELNLDYPENKTIRLYSDEDSIPSSPVPFEYLDLFPYIYICPESQTNEESLRDRFVTYEQIVEMKDGKGDTSPFYETLSSLKKSEDRTAMEHESVKFISGEDPYQGQFLSGLEELQSILKYYEHLGRWLLTQPKVDFNTLSGEVEKRVGSWDNIKKCIEAPEYKDEKERLWETLFALNITLEYDFRILEKVTITLVTARMLERIVDRMSAVPPEKAEDLGVEKLGEDETGSESEVAIEDTVDETPEETGVVEKKLYFNPLSPEPSEGELYRWIHATILLPDTIFPLPPFQGTTSSEINTSVIPYAIGELKMVQYRFRGYQMGEVSHIENILKGECKEVTERQFIQLKESELLGQSLQDERDIELENSNADFLNEVNRTLNPKTTNMTVTKYTTSYENNNIVQDGSWNVSEDPAGGYLEDKTDFAKDVVSRTISRMSQKVNRMRMKSSLSESEEKVIHRFDNTGGENNVMGIYRWLNKMYSLRTVNIGNRLILELEVEKPAMSFLKSECQYHEIRLEKPVSPAELGLESYKKVSESDGNGYYLDFFAKYDISELLSPPPQSKAVTVALESAKPFCTRSLEIPEGYKAETAKVSISSKNTSSKAEIMVGNAVKEHNAVDNPLILTPLNLEQTTIPISIIWLDPKNAENYLANVEIECKRVDHLFREWQLLVFQKIMQGYNKKKEEYYQQIEYQRNKILPPSPHLSKVVEKQQLRRDAFSLFWNIYFDYIGREEGKEAQISGYIMDKSKYFQFFRNSLEWEKMTYYIHPAWDDSENDDFFLDTDLEEILRTEYFEQSDFLNFLKASSARILLPVKPEFTFKFLYFLSSGLVWPGNDDNFVPVTSLHKSLVSEIKALGECKAENKPEENPWEVILPTPMVILQADSHLPEVRDSFENNCRRHEQ